MPHAVGLRRPAGRPAGSRPQTDRRPGRWPRAGRAASGRPTVWKRTRSRSRASAPRQSSDARRGRSVAGISTDSMLKVRDRCRSRRSLAPSSSYDAGARIGGAVVGEDGRQGAVGRLPARRPSRRTAGGREVGRPGPPRAGSPRPLRRPSPARRRRPQDVTERAVVELRAASSRLKDALPWPVAPRPSSRRRAPATEPALQVGWPRGSPPTCSRVKSPPLGGRVEAVDLEGTATSRSVVPADAVDEPPHAASRADAARHRHDRDTGRER